MEERLAIISNIFRSTSEIKVLESFKFSEKGFCGNILLSAYPKEDLFFDVIIPKNYPFIDLGGKSIKFICKNVSGYLHINEDNSICLITPKSSDISARLVLEIEELKVWRDKYYINEEKDEKYDYLIVPNQNNVTFFFTDLKTPFSKNDFGVFEAAILNGNNKSCYITKIGKSECGWSKNIHQLSKGVTGFFYFMADEPIGKGNISFDNWQQLNSVFTQKFLDRLYRLKRDKDSQLSILLGYNIPNSVEIHWQIMAVQIDKIPIKSIKKAPGYYEHFFTDRKIEWGKTINISPSRFFGRGAVTAHLQESKILIVGCGAIGSSLSKILVRSGCKNIDLSDFEIIEPGNICRSEYFLIQSGNFKHSELKNQLNMISPFLESQFILIEKDSSNGGKKNNRILLEKYDYIIDCSSDDELCVYLDSLNLENKVINISISNKANELVCVIGRSAIWQEVKNIFSELDRSENKLFYEGTGCWSPTFEASYFDINALLNLAIKNINFRLEKGLDLNTFIIKNVENNGYLNSQIIDY